MATSSYPRLTSKNIKEHQNRLGKEDSKRQNLKDIPVRTEADGKSSVERFSPAHETIDSNKKHKKASSNKQNQFSNNLNDENVVRPESFPERKTPDGRSNGPSRATVTPNKSHSDNYTEEQTNDGHWQSKTMEPEKGLTNSEQLRNRSNEEDKSDDATPEPRKPTRTRRVRDEDIDSSEMSTQEETASDREDEPSDDSSITQSTSRAPSAYTTGYATSVVESVSTIPTDPPSRADTRISRTSTKSKITRAPSSKSYVSDTPSYILNKNQYKMKQALVRSKKARMAAGETESESSFIISRANSLNETSTAGWATPSGRSKGSYVTLRRFSRLSYYSDEGYSIRDEPTPPRFKKKRNITRRTPKRDLNITSRSNLHQLKTCRAQSEPNMRRKGKQRVTTFIDANLAYETRSNAVSRLSGPRTGSSSRLSTRSIMKQPAPARAKSEPSLRARFRRLSFLENHPLNTHSKTQKSKRSSEKRTKKVQNIVYDIDDVNEFHNKRKRILRRKDRPKKGGKDSEMCESPSFYQEQLSATETKPLKKRKIRTKSKTPLFAKMANANHQTHEKESQTKLQQLKKAKKANMALSSQDESNDESSQGINDNSSDEDDDDLFLSEDIDSAITSASSIVLRKSPLIKFIKDNSHEYQSSPTSYRPPMTPASFRYHRSPSPRSYITEYYSYPSRPVTRGSRNPSGLKP